MAKIKKLPLVTVYIPSRNYGKFLEKSVLSVIDQLYLEWELFIIDEGSTDNTKTIAENYQNKYPTKIKLIQNKEPLGLQKLANDLLDIAKGKYIIRLDADDWFHEVALLSLVNKLEESPKAGIAYGNYFYTDHNGNIIGIETRYKLGKEDISGHLPPHGACTLVETEALRNVDGYLESVNAQDGWDLWYKLFKKIGAINIDLPVFYYRQHKKSLSKDYNRLLKARAKIFEQIRKSSKEKYKPRVLAVIPVKESYPELKNVPYQKIQGKSLLEIAINNALDSNQISELIVSSESKDVLKFSEDLEKKQIVRKHHRLLRRESIELNKIPINDFLIKSANYYNKLYKCYPDILVYLSLHAVNRKKFHIDSAINTLIVSESDSVISVQEEREPMFKYGRNGLDLINPGRFKDLSFDRERLYRFNGSIIASLWHNVSNNNLFGLKTSFIEMTHKDSIQIKDKSLFD